MDFNDHIGRLNAFFSYAGQGKSHAMMYHALCQMQPFVFISSELTETSLYQSIKRLVAANHIDRFCSDILLKHAPLEDNFLHLWNKYEGYKNIYIDNPYLNIDQLVDVMGEKNVSITQHTAHFGPEEKMPTQLHIFTENNIFKKYTVSRQENSVTVSGSENFSFLLR